MGPSRWGSTDDIDRPPRGNAVRRVLAVGGLLLVVCVLAAIGWAGWTMWSAEQHLRAAQAHLEDARSAIQGLDSEAAASAAEAAKVESGAAADLAQRRIWSAAAALPKVGDTPEAARALVLAADAAVTGVAGLATAARALAADDLFLDGQVDLAAVSAAGAAATGAGESLALATERLAAMPTAASGGWVIGPVEDARAELSAQLDELIPATDGLEKAGTLLPGLLGADGPRRYFVAVQAPNETRGTGGLVGTWAVLAADDGRISVADVGSNGDLPNLDAMPASFDADYLARYGDDPTLFVNMNLSPDFPSAATLWLASWKKATGEELDGVLGIDVTAIGDMLAASGASLTGPDGEVIAGEQFADFTLAGIYEKFPTGADVEARKAYQEVLAAQALAAVLRAGDPIALVRALERAVSDRRVAMWVGDSEAQEALAETGVGHSLQPASAHSVEPVLINIGWSKLDTYIEREFEYEVGRCVDGGEVTSNLTMRFTSDLPEGVELPEYVVGAVPVGPTGPVNRLILQGHLPPGAQIQELFVDGESSEYWEFVEAGRPAVGYILDLPPREEREVRVEFREPADGGPGEVLVQPMARGAAVSVTEQPC